MYKIICVEDDFNLANQIKTALQRFDYDIILIEDFSNIHEFIINENPHLVIMDINLPYNDGFYWTKKIREQSNVPILFMSSRDERLEQVIAISIGADDYITKPIDLDLTIVKIQALLRRAYAYELDNKNANVLSFNNLILNINQLTLEYNNQFVDLTKSEFKIMQKLLMHQGEYVKREALMNYLWDNDSFIDDNAFNVNLSRLRKKIEQLYQEDIIETKRKVGYKIG